MFGETLSLLVEHSADPAWLERHFDGARERHREYGVPPEAYAWVREALLDALAEVAGGAGLPRSVLKAWAALYDRAARTMLRASGATNSVRPPERRARRQRLRA
jgi:hemoglobin-like flavoprotein